MPGFNPCAGRGALPPEDWRIEFNINVRACVRAGVAVFAGFVALPGNAAVPVRFPEFITCCTDAKTESAGESCGGVVPLVTFANERDSKESLSSLLPETCAGPEPAGF